MNRHHRSKFLTRLLATAWLSFASLSQSGAAVPEGRVRTDLSFLAWDNSTRKAELHFESSGESIEPRLDFRQRSQPYPYDGSPSLTLYRYGTDERGNRVPIPAARVQLPANVAKTLILVRSDAAGEKVNAFAFPDGADFPWGSIKFINFSELPLAIRVGDDVLPLPYRESKIVEAESESLKATVQMATPDSENGGYKRVYSANWGVYPNCRHLAFIVPSDTRNRNDLVDVRVVSEWQQTESDPAGN